MQEASDALSKLQFITVFTIFITVFTTIHWVKLAWPAEPILLTSTSLTKAVLEDAG